METMQMIIVAGAGGKESRDFARILRDMYLNRFERNADEIGEGDSSGMYLLEFSSDEIGKVQCDAGIHRFVRISPFDEQGRRHTSFCTVIVDNKEPPQYTRRSIVLHPYQAVTAYNEKHEKIAEIDDVDAYLRGEVYFEDDEARG